MMKSLELETPNPLTGVSTVGADKLQAGIVKIILNWLWSFCN